MLREWRWIYLAALSMALLLSCFPAFAAVTSEIEPNDSASAAMWLGAVTQTGSSVVVEAASDYPGDSDWYRFSLDEPARVACSAQSEAGGMKLVLFDETVVYIASSVELLWRELPRGEYVLRVDAADLSVGAYVLTLTRAMEEEPNGDVPNELGSLSVDGELRVYGSIGLIGDIDLFSFVVPEELHGAQVEIAVDGPGDDDSQLTLLRAGPERLWIGTDLDSGRGFWSAIQADLPAGEYMIIMSEEINGAVIEEYWLTISVAVPDPYESNDTLSTAYSLGVISAEVGETLTAFCSEGDEDHFSFELIEDALVAFALEGKGDGDSVLTLYSAAGREVDANDDRSLESSWSGFRKVLPAGQYIIAVAPYEDWLLLLPSDPFSYTLTLAVAASPSGLPEEEPNGTMQDSMALPKGGAVVSGTVGGADTADILRLDVSTRSTLYVGLAQGSEDDIILTLADAVGSTLETTWDAVPILPASRQLEREVPAGTYYVQIESSSEEAVSYEVLVASP